MRFLLVLLLLLGAPAFADPDPQASERAIAKAVEWIKVRQEKSGRFRGPHEKSYKTGETALCLLALLKGGVDPADPRIERGFAWLLEQPLENTYEVSIAILAVEALHTPSRKASAMSGVPLQTQIRRRFKRNAKKAQRDFVRKACKWLVKSQGDDGLWAYPAKRTDLSNSQFAVLALAAGARMGAVVPRKTYLAVLERLLAWQVKEGKACEPFAVPAADHSIQGLHDRREGTRVRSKKTSTSTRAMRARGWAYHEGHDPGPRASMTAAALAMLVICKSELEGRSGYGRHADAVNESLRDGAAFLATVFSVAGHPGVPGRHWLVYWLYSLERAGTLLGLERFGSHEWYAQGAARVLGLQAKDGGIVHQSRWTCGDVASTCLGLLFLRSSTVPVIPRVVTQKVQREVEILASEDLEGRAGETLEVALRFRGGPTQRPQRVFVHVVDDEGKIRFQGDHDPPKGSDAWAGEETWGRALDVPKKLAPGTYRVRVGLYHEESGQRLPLEPLEGVRPDGELRYEVCLLKVKKARKARPKRKTKADLAREAWEKAQVGKREVAPDEGPALKASFCCKHDTLTALSDGRLPRFSSQDGLPRFTWWSHKGTREWVELRFAEPTPLSRVRVYWFDDRPKGGCRVPKSWSLLYQEGESWRPVKLIEGQTYGVRRDGLNEVRFAEVKVKVLRLEAQLQEGHSAGIFELEADRGD